MKIAVKTINKYLKKPLSTEKMIELIGRTEIEVEEVLYAKQLDAKIILAKITDVFPHPDADRLRLVDIEYGVKKHERVVCGAPNVAVGQRVAWVQPGSILPDGTEIKRAEIRGQLSAGMLASAKELHLSDDHSGILELEEDTHPLGTSLCDIVFLSDVLDVKTPANRWDYLGGEGIAREISAYSQITQFAQPERTEYVYQNTDAAKVKAREENRRFMSVRLRVDNDVKTPAWLVDNLLANGFVPHNPVVDITNYVMLETGQPSHAYDARKLHGPLAVRFAKSGEKLTTLDDVERTLSDQDLVVCDDSGPIGLAGVIGGASTQIDVDTTEIVLEAAHWDKTLVRRSAIRHGVRTEASARFERNLPLPLQPHAFARLLDLLVQICDAEIIDGPYDQLYAWPWRRFLGVRLRRAEKYLGMKLDEPAMLKGLRKLGFDVRHFSLSAELKSHLGKPYKWGANFRQDGETAFDCSYLVDRLYSKIGVSVGHTALGQLHHGRPVEVSELKPGDVVFYEGKIEKSQTDHYYRTMPDGTKEKVVLNEPKSVGHNGVYIGNGLVIHAAIYKYRDGRWIERKQQGVITSPLSEFTDNPGYLGARRYVESFNHILALEVPWWRTDVTNETDIFEELAKLTGYENLPETLPQLPPMPGTAQSLQVENMRLRHDLVRHGATEINSYSFISAEDVKLSQISDSEVLQIANPRSPEQAYLRSTMFASHARFWSRQPQKANALGVFEISRVYRSQGIVDQPKESWQLAISAHGENALERIRGLLHAVLDDTRAQISFGVLTQDDVYVPQRSAALYAGQHEVGTIGQVKTAVRTGFELAHDFAFCSINLELLTQDPRPYPIRPLPPYQLVTRDISLESPDAMLWQDVDRILSAVKHVWKVDFISSYRDVKLEDAGRKVITARLWLDLGAQPSLADIDRVTQRAVKSVQERLKAHGKIALR